MDSQTVIFLSVFINRVTETLKRGFLNGLTLSTDPDINDSRKGAIILFVSLVLGALGVVLLFPSTNLVAGLGSSALAEQVVTGVIIGGFANGIDFLAKGGTALFDRITGSDGATLAVSAPNPSPSVN